MIEYYKNLSLESLFYINEDGLVCQEEWRDVSGYVGLYQASNLGRVKSLKRDTYRNCVKRKGYFATTKEIMLKQSLNKQGYLVVFMSLNKKAKLFKTHQIVAMAFLGHTPCGYEILVDHIIEENPLDNRSCNLQLITPRENAVKNKMHKSKKSIGCSFSKKNKKWMVRILHNKKEIYLGCYETELLASNKYNEALMLIEKGETPVFKGNDTRRISKYKGVFFCKVYRVWKSRKWDPILKKMKHLGSFKTEEEAHTAYLHQQR